MCVLNGRSIVMLISDFYKALKKTTVSWFNAGISPREIIYLEAILLIHPRVMNI